MGGTWIGFWWPSNGEEKGGREKGLSFHKLLTYPPFRPLLPQAPINST